MNCLMIPRIGTIVYLDKSNLIQDEDNSDLQMRIKYDTASDSWLQVGKEENGFIIWLKSYDDSANAVRIAGIHRSGTSAWATSYHMDLSD